MQKLLSTLLVLVLAPLVVLAQNKYPIWGNVVNGKVNKVHLIGHSMGGQTVRTLAQLLNKGSAGAPVAEDVSLGGLFAGGKDWVHSVTTISTPNQGANLADVLATIGETVKDVIIGVLATVNIGGSTTKAIYDAKLDQWGLAARGSAETLSDYLERVFSSRIFRPGFKDIASWSLSVPGTKEESTWVKTLPNIYYYSYATSDTFGARDLLLRKIELPNVLTMNPIFQPIGTFLGSRWTPDNGYGVDWQANDGVVPVESQWQDYTGAAVEFSGRSVIGKWNKMPLLDHMDHAAIIGITLHTEVKDVYVAHAKMLASLPTRSSSGMTTTAIAMDAAADDAGFGVAMAVAKLNAATARVKTKDDIAALCASPANEFVASYCAEMLKSANTTRRLRA
ncbi:hypothetical protein PybrP1_006151 [[Pythium] brassicae (nom. inval.)]|nr:hypothetical protein PybrP1_006151 [[Pythium] brassicae (nom. inval.)]